MQNFPNNIVLTSLLCHKYYTMCRRLSMSIWWSAIDGSERCHNTMPIIPVITAVYI